MLDATKTMFCNVLLVAVSKIVTTKTMYFYILLVVSIGYENKSFMVISFWQIEECLVCFMP